MMVTRPSTTLRGTRQQHSLPVALAQYLGAMDHAKLQTLFDLTGRTAIITGGTRGIGRAMAEGFVAAGANVVVSSRKADACEETEAHLKGMGGNALGIPANMGAPETGEALVAAAVDAFGGVDILVNNAANALALPVGHQTPEGWTKSFDVNLRGPALLIQAATPQLAESNHASIINVSSIGAFMFANGTSMYASMKAALLGLTRSYAAELGTKNIRVNAIAPGTVDTDMTRNTESGPDAMAMRQIIARPAHADEMVGPALFLASDASSFVTGQTLIADGGMHPH